jgi:hypothetical protein
MEVFSTQDGAGEYHAIACMLGSFRGFDLYLGMGRSG